MKFLISCVFMIFITNVCSTPRKQHKKMQDYPIIFHCLLYSIIVDNVFLQYAKETQHEKILRGLALGIALTMYGRLEEADALIDSLCLDKDPILRWSGMFTLAMAYCGSGSNQAIRKLLHVAVSQSLYLFQSLFFLNSRLMN